MDLKIKSETVFDKLGNCLMKVRMENGGQVEEKILPLERYLAVLGDSSLMKSSEMIHIGAVPEGYYDAKLSMEDQSTFDIVLFYKEQKRAMKYAGKHWVVPFPSLAFYYKVKKGTLESGYAYALATNEANQDAILYKYPFGNVSDDGKICFGNIRHEKLDSMQDAGAISDEFFCGETNGDYFDRKNAVTFSQAEMLTRLKKMEHFPVEWLSPQKKSDKSTMTLGQLMEKDS